MKRVTIDAGFMRFKSGTWGVSGSAYRGMVAGVVRLLPDSQLAMELRQPLTDSLDMFSDDFMDDRAQPSQRARETLFD